MTRPVAEDEDIEEHRWEREPECKGTVPVLRLRLDLALVSTACVEPHSLRLSLHGSSQRPICRSLFVSLFGGL